MNRPSSRPAGTRRGRCRDGRGFEPWRSPIFFYAGVTFQTTPAADHLPNDRWRSPCSGFSAVVTALVGPMSHHVSGPHEPLNEPSRRPAGTRHGRCQDGRGFEPWRSLNFAFAFAFTFPFPVAFSLACTFTFAFTICPHFYFSPLPFLKNHPWRNSNRRNPSYGMRDCPIRLARHATSNSKCVLVEG